MNTEELKTILRKGTLAPSADNLQPWIFKTEWSQDPHVDLYLDREKINSFCDTGWLMPYLSAGAVLENMRIAGSALGFKMKVQYFPKPQTPDHVAVIHFDKAQHRGDPLYDCLDSRVTNRRFYCLNQKRIPDHLFHELRDTITGEAGFNLFWVKNDDPDFAKISAWIGLADQLRFENERLHRELMMVMRLDHSSAEATRDGLPIKALDAGPGAGLLFRCIQSWKNLRVLNGLGLSRMFNLYARMQMNSSQALGFIVAPSQCPEDYIRGGALMERLWLKLTRDGFSMQPMEALPIFILNLQLNEGRDFSENHKVKLMTLKNHFLNHFGLNDRRGLIMLFRAGYSPESPSARSLRKPLEAFIQEKLPQVQA